MPSSCCLALAFCMTLTHTYQHRSHFLSLRCHNTSVSDVHVGRIDQVSEWEVKGPTDKRFLQSRALFNLKTRIERVSVSIESLSAWGRILEDKGETSNDISMKEKHISTECELMLGSGEWRWWSHGTDTTRTLIEINYAEAIQISWKVLLGHSLWEQNKILILFIPSSANCRVRYGHLFPPHNCWNG